MAVLSFFVLKPFLSAILASIFVAYAFYPVYRFINGKIRRKNISAVIVSILVVLVISAPLILLINAFSKEAYVTYLTVKQKMTTGNIFGIDCTSNQTSSVCPLTIQLEKLATQPKVRYQIDHYIEKATSYIGDVAYVFLFKSLPAILLNIIILLVLMFYLFRDGPGLLKKFMETLPLKKSYKETLLSRSNEVVFAVIYGYMMIALLEGTLAIAGFAIFKVSSPILLGIIIFLLTFIPFIGPLFVWAPLVFLNITSGNIIAAAGLLILGLILSVIDTFLKPWIVGGKSKVHPILILLGLLGGVKVFGFVGIIIGPVLLALFLTFIKVYEED